MPCGPRMKQIRTPGRMVVGSLVNSTPVSKKAMEEPQKKSDEGAQIKKTEDKKGS